MQYSIFPLSKWLHSVWWCPGSSIREGNGTPLQYSCLENPIDGGAWWAAVHGVTKSQTRLSNFTLNAYYFPQTGILPLLPWLTWASPRFWSYTSSQVLLGESHQAYTKRKSNRVLNENLKFIEHRKVYFIFIYMVLSTSLLIKKSWVLQMLTHLLLITTLEDRF